MMEAKPRQVTSMNAVPVTAAGARCTTSAENCGESATTAGPHTKHGHHESRPGQRQQQAKQAPDTASATRTVRRLPS